MSTPRIEWALISEYAYNDAQQRGCAIGLFQQVFVQGFPAELKSVAITAHVLAEPGPLPLVVRLIDPKKKILRELSGQITLQTSFCDFCCTLPTAILEQPGTYCVEMWTRDSLIHSERFEVAQLPVRRPH